MFGMSISSVSSIVTKPKGVTKTKVYSLNKNIAPLSDAIGNLTVVCMPDDCLRVYMGINNGNVWVCDVGNNTWTQSTSSTNPTFYRRAWKDIVCTSNGEHVFCVATSSIVNDPSGILFYSNNYGVNFSKLPFIDGSNNNNSWAVTSGGIYGTNLAINSDGSALYYSQNSTANVGYIHKSTDYGNTWTRIYSYPAIGGYMKCDVTGRYIWAGGNFTSQISVDYGNTGAWKTTTQTFNQAPKYFTNIETNRFGNLQVATIAYGNNAWNGIGLSQFKVNGNIASTAVGLAPFANVLGTTTVGSRMPVAVNTFKNIMAFDVMTTNENGNIYLGTNLDTFVSGNAMPFFTNYSQAEGLGMSVWCGLKANYNDSIVFSNKRGNVYIYSWTLQ